MNSPLWRHITHPDGMTVSLLVKATGLPVKQVRAELNALEAAGKIVRERAPIGKEHLWWRAGSRPLDDLTVMVAMALAARIHSASGTVRAVIRRLSTLAENPSTRQSLKLCATVKPMHATIHAILDLYIELSEADKARKAALQPEPETVTEQREAA